MTMEPYGLLEYYDIAREQRAEEIENLLNEAIIIAGLFYVPPETVNRMEEINDRLTELGL